MLDKRNLFRMPWSLNDNPIAWLEVTDICNIHCDGCYRQHLSGHKSLEQIEEEIHFFKTWRNPDNVSIAGGEPLIHPQILEIVSSIARNDIKPIILTNGQALTPELLKDLKKAGAAGFTIHVDSHQNRPSWKNKTEKELNELRQRYADMIASEGGMTLIFNSTVYPSTFPEIPDVVSWAQSNIDRVHGLVFITYRIGILENTSASDGIGQDVDLSRLSYTTDSFDEKFVTSKDIYQLLKDKFPGYEASGYLGGTIMHDSFKWLIGSLVASKKKIYGAVGKKTMEISQNGHHLVKGTYLAYLSGSRVGARMFLLAPFDKILRQAWWNWMKAIVRNPARLFEGIYLQSIGIIQAPDMLEDGRMDMCDSCPDVTIWDGKLVNSCRMDENRLYGAQLRFSPSGKPIGVAATPRS